MNQFIFLYPIDEIFDFEIRNGAAFHQIPSRDKKFALRIKKAKNPDEQMAMREQELKTRIPIYKKFYGKMLNEAIELRYRQNGFRVNFATLDDIPVSGIIQLNKNDRIIKIGLTSQQHYGEKKEQSEDFILDQLGNIDCLVVAGFHSSETGCVEKLAKRAYEKGISVLVDEDLTENFTRRIRLEGFNIGVYPSVFPFGEIEAFRRSVKPAIQRRPWLFQDYERLWRSSNLR